jgi:hypothetical protein
MGILRTRWGAESGELHRNVYYFTPKIRVPLRATQAEAKRANAKK